jgi:hypothetical protein
LAQFGQFDPHDEECLEMARCANLRSSVIATRLKKLPPEKEILPEFYKTDWILQKAIELY